MLSEHTKSNAAILRLNLLSESVGLHFPTRSVLGLSSLTDLSCHFTFSGGFLEVGVKNVEIALSVQLLVPTIKKSRQTYSSSLTGPWMAGFSSMEVEIWSLCLKFALVP